MTILDQLAEHAKRRVEIAKEIEPLEAIKERALTLPKGDFEFEKALAKKDLSFICEVKKASPEANYTIYERETQYGPVNNRRGI